MKRTAWIVLSLIFSAQVALASDISSARESELLNLLKRLWFLSRSVAKRRTGPSTDSGCFAAKADRIYQRHHSLRS